MGPVAVEVVGPTDDSPTVVYPAAPPRTRRYQPPRVEDTPATNVSCEQRRSGKNRIACWQKPINSPANGELIDLDEPALLDPALNDPVGLLAGLERPTGIDEFQHGGDGLLLALKRELDQNSLRGQFQLAGSTRFLTTQSVADTLTGRIGILELLPFSVGELRGITERFSKILSPEVFRPGPQRLGRTTQH